MGAYLCPLVSYDNFTFTGVDLARFDFRLSNETFLGTDRKCTSCFCCFFLLQNFNCKRKSRIYGISSYLRQTKAVISAISSRIPMPAAETGSAADKVPPCFGPSCISWTVLFLCSPQFLDPKTYLESRLTSLFWPTPYLRVHLSSLDSDLKKTKKLQPTARLHSLLQSSTVKTPK